MKRMLFNATQPEELRVAIVDGQKLTDLDIESVSKEQRKSNIYKAVITRLEPGLEAAFVDYGGGRHGFLPFKEISPGCFEDSKNATRSRIPELLHEGQEIIVQVDKDERGNKGAALTTYISLAGRYLVLIPNNSRGGGVSRRITGDERTELREVIASLEIQEGMSIIARTAGIGRSTDELQWDLNYLTQLWQAIEEAAKSQSGVFLIYQESSLVIRAIRDYFSYEIGEILIDSREIYEQACQFMTHVMPASVDRLKFYNDDTPLFSRFQIEHQIETAHSREVSLPAGGAIVIDHTEALVSVDVNSARAIRGTDIENTALNTNLEAAEEIARQLRLRDLGGLVVIDFIDMEVSRNQREVENQLHESIRADRARIQVGKISRFGLLELSRQRLRPSLEESNYLPCTRCHGTGYIRGTDSSALHILRIIQEEAMKENTGALHVQLPIDVATYLLNEKRAEIHDIEARLKLNVILIPNVNLETPNYSIDRLRNEDTNSKSDETLASYQMVDKTTEEIAMPSIENKSKSTRQKAAVQNITPTNPAPIRTEKARESLLDKFFGWFKPVEAEEEKTEAAIPEKNKERTTRGRGRGRGRNDRNKEATGNRQRKQQTRQSDDGSLPNEQKTADEAAKPEQKIGSQTSSRRRRPTKADKLENETQSNTEENTATEDAPREARPRSRGRRRNTRQDRTSSTAKNNENTTQENDETATTHPKKSVSTDDTAKDQSKLKDSISSDNIDLTTQSAAPLAAASVDLSVSNSVSAQNSETATTSNTEDKAQKANVQETPSIPDQPKPAPAYEPPDLSKSGLVMIETASDRVETESTTEELSPPKRQRRKAKATTEIKEENLMQVETRD